MPEVSREVDFDLPFGQGLSRAGLVLRRLMLRTRAKLHGAFGMVVALHRQTANAFAVLVALPIVAGDGTKVSMHVAQYSSRRIMRC
jgi:hypothetical protein